MALGEGRGCGRREETSVFLTTARKQRSRTEEAGSNDSLERHKILASSGKQEDDEEGGRCVRTRQGRVRDRQDRWNFPRAVKTPVEAVVGRAKNCSTERNSVVFTSRIHSKCGCETIRVSISLRRGRALRPSSLNGKCIGLDSSVRPSERHHVSHTKTFSMRCPDRTSYRSYLLSPRAATNSIPPSDRLLRMLGRQHLRSRLRLGQPDGLPRLDAPMESRLVDECKSVARFGLVWSSRFAFVGPSGPEYDLRFGRVV